MARNLTRRESLALIGSAMASTKLVRKSALAACEDSGTRSPHVATNVYPWITFARRSGKPFAQSSALLADVAKTGVAGFEPILHGPGEVEELGKLLKESGLEMRSLYVNSTLHESSRVDASIALVLAIANAARRIGTRIIVTNPAPIRWGGTEDKSDAQLRTQSAALDRLGAELRKLGVTLAYHNHDAELRQGAREFHHMLTATDPANVKLCLDAHWVFRGCGDSEVALFDALTHYHSRVVELHLRQSIGGVWTEVFLPEGDISYPRLFEFPAARKIRPQLVLEQAVEEKSPEELDVVEAHRRGRVNLLRMLG